MRLQERTIALVGNPNVGKSTIFNALTDSKQHTGNWAGKTVDTAAGKWHYKGKEYTLVDLPGTYSLQSQSKEEQVTADYLHSRSADGILIVADATALERSLSFALQIIVSESIPVLLCVNLMDEAKKKGIVIDLDALQQALGVPVVGTAAGDGAGIDHLKEHLRILADGFTPQRPVELQGDAVSKAEEICRMCIAGKKPPHLHPFDQIALHPWLGRLLMMVLLFGVLWLTMVGANYPSDLLELMFSTIQQLLHQMLRFVPAGVRSLLIDGIYGTTAKVISVMLPPMLIFFPLFTFLEDLGYLPRIAFLADHAFQCCGSCGKQALTMTMGLGCNAVGVMGSRIIASPRERLAAIVTNALVPCNGRFPALIALSGFLVPHSPLAAASVLCGFILLSICMSMLATKALTATVLRNSTSCFVMEMPSYRKPSIKKILRNAVIEKTVYILTRAILVSAPAGALIWFLDHTYLGEITLLTQLADWLQPAGTFIGLNGAVLLAFFLSFPANELFLPMVISITGASMSQAPAMLILCTAIFLLFHWPCSTTCLTIYRETKSVYWTVLAVLLPTLIGVTVCLLLNCIAN